MYGFGYASAQDRLWLHDVLRAIGRGRFSEFLGPASDTFDFDGNLAVVAGYSEENLNAFVDRSLRNLATDSLDLVQLHCPPTQVFYTPALFDGLDALKAKGADLNAEDPLGNSAARLANGEIRTAAPR